MFVTMIDCGGNGTMLPLAGRGNEPATIVARPRQGQVAVAGDLTVRRAGAQQLM